MTHFKKIKDIDQNLITQEALEIVAVAGWENCQISLQYTDKVSWHDDIDRYGSVRQENSCINFNPYLDGSYIREVLTSFDFPVASARLMILFERNCYSTHVDLFTRYHIPVVSNPLMSFMVFPDIPFIARMPLGSVYWTNTHQLHNFVNGDHVPRIHLIFNDATELPNYNNPYLKVLHGDRFTQQS